jgi:FkbM family methyltransferase
MGTTAKKHHPLMEAYKPAERLVPSGYSMDMFGMITAPYISRSSSSAYELPSANEDLPLLEKILSLPLEQKTGRPCALDEEYFEALDVIESVKLAGNSYIMFELGAGYGRWGIRAWHQARRHGIENPHIVFVEAEPVHLRDLAYHLNLNQIPEAHTTIYDVAVSDSEKIVSFSVASANAKNARHWYGQSIDYKHGDVELPNMVRSEYFGRPMHFDTKWRRGYIDVQCHRLTTMMKPYETIDLLDLDIQGEEAVVMREAIGGMNAKVKRVHIGTHGHKIEADLVALFTEHGWKNIYNFACKSTTETPYGTVDFCDGIQTWLNPKFL